MSAIDRFLSVAGIYRRLTGLKTTALSWRLFGDSKKLGALESGADIQVTRYEKALQWLSDNWPADADARWPAEVPRPPKTPAPANTDATPAPAESAGAAA
ncbi:hypothetical protein [Methylobacterium hispanicum]|uniref:hypothetical protein n=1 Tax=Methylobacterium hispanicum TaxID=270350 RepID=UPI002F2D15D3